jgi:hypothetical protein
MGSDNDPAAAGRGRDPSPRFVWQLTIETAREMMWPTETSWHIFLRQKSFG